MENILNNLNKETIMTNFKSYDNLIKLKTYILGENQVNSKDTCETFNFLNRIIYINDEITQELAQEIFEIIYFWNTVDNKENKPIKIFINTEGGDLEACFTIISAIKLSKIPVYTCNIGKAHSAGFLILISGHKSFGTPYATYLFHEGSYNGTINLDAHKFLQWSEDYKNTLEEIKQLIINNTKIYSELYEEHKKDDWFFDNKTALQYRIIEKVITNFNEIEEENK